MIYMSTVMYKKGVLFLNKGKHRLENLFTRTVQSVRVGCSRRVHKITYLIVKQGNILVNILLLRIFFAS